MKIDFEDIKIKSIDERDFVHLQDILERSNDYFEEMTGLPVYSSATLALSLQVPENKEEKDKFLLGIYKGYEGELIGVMDLIKDYPDLGIWFLGFLMIDKKFRSKGIGKKVILNLVERLKEEKSLAIRTRVIDKNVKALNFFYKLGFLKLYVEGNFLILERRLLD